MKMHILTVAAAALLAIPSTTISADGDKPDGKRPGPGGPGGRGGFSPEERLKRMTEFLGLTADQQAKIKTIFDAGADQMKALREKGRENLTDDDKAKMKEFFQRQKEEIDAVLTPEQKEKMKERVKERAKDGGPRPGGEGRPNKPNREKPPGDAK